MHKDNEVLTELMNITYCYNRKLEFLCDTYVDCKGCPLSGIDCKNIREVSAKLSNIVTPYKDYVKHIGIISSELLDDEDVVGFYYVVPKNTLYSSDTHKLYVVLRDTDDISYAISKTLRIQSILEGYFSRLNMLVDVEIFEEGDIDCIVNRLDCYKYDSLNLYGDVSYEVE